MRVLRGNVLMRGILILIVSLLCLSSVQASRGRKARPRVDKHVPIETVASLPSASAKDEFRVTPTTEVLLDGRPCRYEHIPDSAIIILLETISNESKEITRIHFRSSRRPTSPINSK